MRTSATRLAMFAAPALLLIGCSSSNEDPFEVPDPDLAIASCEGCHTDYDALVELHTPDSIIPTGGCSGPPPYIEPYDRVFLEPVGFAAFQATTHGQQDCTHCHGGVDGTADKATAHSSGFVKHPSFEALDVCADCHGGVVSGFENGLHFNGWGQKNSQIRRAGVQSFDQLHAGIQEGYDQNCARCHASCGSCHVNRPPAGGGGLRSGHSFQAPDMRDNCTACHESRGGHAYYGVGTGTKPDVHLAQQGFTCLSCHSTDEMHASTGTVYDHRYQVEALPECTDCHTGIASSNPYHMMHMGDFNCQVCHSQDYNTCGSCHVAGEGARIHSHLSFKIGLNPLPNERPYEYSTLRRTLAAPDSWAVYGVDQLSSFDSKPLYNYTSPHNILRWTSRTEVEEGASCYSSCHIIQEGDTYRNRHLYLFTSDLSEGWERSAAAGVVVDGRLPASWGIH